MIGTHKQFLFTILAFFCTPLTYASNHALDLDGSDDFVDGSSTLTSSAFTVEAWVKPALVNVGQVVISTLNEPQILGMELNLVNNSVSLTIPQSNTWKSISVTSSAIVAGSWIHIAGTCGNNTCTLYLNGESVASQSTTAIAMGTSPIRIGRRSVGFSGSFFFQGAIDEVQVWNTSRTPDQIRADYVGYETAQVGQQFYYKCNQGVVGEANPGVTKLSDLTGNGDMTLSNFTLTGSTSNWVDGYRIPQSISVSGLADMSPGDTLPLAATVPSGYAVSFTSSDPSIAKIENDKLIALKIGSVTISATQNGDSIWAPAITQPSIEIRQVLGSGTDTDPYLIGTYEQLKMVGTVYPLAAHYRLKRDINASASALLPFPCIQGDFQGAFHGGGHRIRNLTISGLAFFQRLAVGTVDSVGFININVPNGVAGIAGTLLEATIHASYVTGKIINLSSGQVGGLVALNQSSTLDSCFFSGTVSGNTVGGLIGYSQGSTKINNSYATGSVIGSNIAGGLIGSSEHGSIQNSYSTAWVSASKNSGGLIGSTLVGQVSDSWVAGHVDPTGSAGVVLGVGTITYSNVTVDSQAVGINAATWANQFYTTYEMVSQSKYTGIAGVSDAPFAFLNRSISIGAMSGQKSKLLQTVVSADNTPLPLVVRVDSLCGTLLDTANGDLHFATGTAYGTYDSLFFTAGAIQASGDTLWGNKVKAVVEFVSDPENIGTESNPHIVYSYQNLQNLRANPTHVFKLANDIDASASSQDKFHPIGDGTNRPNLGVLNPYGFSGVLHGGGHSIANLTVAPAEKTTYTGLFAYIAGIDSLSLTNAVIQGNSSAYTGGFVAVLDPGAVIQDCFFSGTVDGSTIVGGFVGANEGTILRSYNIGNITGAYEVGGIAGTNTGLISNTYNSGIVIGDSVGGIVGHNVTQKDVASVLNSYNIGSIQGTNAGGIAGTNTGTIGNCHFDSTLSGQQDSTKGIANSTQEMKDIRTFTYWDFSNTWYIDNGNTYPTLAWQVPQYGTPAATAIILQHPDTLKLFVTQQMQLSVASLPAGSLESNLIYATSDANLVQVDVNGLLIASIQNTGIAKITVTVPNSTLKDSMWVKVYGQVFAGGDGSENDPFQIETISQLDSIRLFSGSHFVLMNDLDMDTSPYSKAIGNGWTPLVFKGVRGIAQAQQDTLQFFLDGQGHVIRNLYSYNQNGGLFYNVKRSSIKNLGIENATLIKGTNRGILGFFSYSSVYSQVYVTGSIAQSINAGGFLLSSVGDSISDCYAMVSISATRIASGFLYNLTGKTSNSYSVGTVAAANATSGFISMKTSGAWLINTFYDMTVSGLSDASNGTPKSTAAMKNEETFSDANWNVWSATNPSATWVLSPNCNGGYPCLTWQFQDPTVSTDKVQSIQNTSAEIVGTINDLSAFSIVRHGFVWSTKPNPIVGYDSILDLGSSTASSAFSSLITHLLPHTKYYVRAFATSAAGTGYGAQITFTTANALPTIANSTLNTLEDHAIAISLDAILAADPDGDSMNLLLQTGDSYSLAGFLVTPNKDFFGTLNIPYKITDGIDTTSLDTLYLNVEAVNDAPNFVAGSDASIIFNNPSVQVIPNWAKSIFSGATNESLQTFTFQVTNSNSSLFQVQPAISSSGELSFTPAKEGNGSCTVSVRLMDNGGVTNGGVDSSAVATFVITIEYNPTTRITDAETAPFIDKESIPTFDLLGRKVRSRIQSMN